MQRVRGEREKHHSFGALCIMVRMLKRYILFIYLVGLFLTFGLGVGLYVKDLQRDYVTILAFAEKHGNEDVIVVSKKSRLLYYFKNGRMVRNEKWKGFTLNFPVKVSLAGRFYRTPEGEMFIDRKNARSRYTLFLSLSNPGDYGIHGASTRLKSYLDKKEKLDPNFEFVTKKDATRGCVATENRVIKYLFSQVNVNTPVLILP